MTWRTHSCVPCRDFLDTWMRATVKAGVETSLDAARTSARATQLFLEFLQELQGFFMSLCILGCASQVGQSRGNIS